MLKNLSSDILLAFPLLLGRSFQMCVSSKRVVTSAVGQQAQQRNSEKEQITGRSGGKSGDLLPGLIKGVLKSK